MAWYDNTLGRTFKVGNDLCRSIDANWCGVTAALSDRRRTLDPGSLVAFHSTDSGVAARGLVSSTGFTTPVPFEATGSRMELWEAKCTRSLSSDTHSTEPGPQVRGARHRYITIVVCAVRNLTRCSNGSRCVLGRDERWVWMLASLRHWWIDSLLFSSLGCARYLRTLTLMHRSIVMLTCHRSRTTHERWLCVGGALMEFPLILFWFCGLETDSCLWSQLALRRFTLFATVSDALEILWQQ